MNISQIALTVGALSGAMSIMTGAFGAHALKTKVNEKRIEAFNTAVQYQMTHTIVLLFIGIISTLYPQTVEWSWVVAGFITGIILFSGSLYALVLLDKPILGIITPIGGTVLIISWLLLAVQCWTMF